MEEKKQDARQYFESDAARDAFYGLFFQIYREHRVDWASATEQEKAAVTELLHTAWNRR